jgi:predicted transcriptional regulator of viral defense system
MDVKELTEEMIESASVRRLAVRIQGEYREMPGLSVTTSQAQRLWGIDPDMCELVLRILIRRGFLRRTARGTYVLA